MLFSEGLKNLTSHKSFRPPLHEPGLDVSPGQLTEGTEKKVLPAGAWVASDTCHLSWIGVSPEFNCSEPLEVKYQNHYHDINSRISLILICAYFIPLHKELCGSEVFLCKCRIKINISIVY